MLPPHQNDRDTGEGNAGRDARIEALARQAEVLSQGVSDLMEGTGTAIVGLAKRGRSTHRWVVLIGASLLLDLLLTLVVTFTLTRVESTGHRVDGLSTNLRGQICGMLTIFVNSDTPANAAVAKARGDDMTARANSYAIIHRSFTALECSKLVR